MVFNSSHSTHHRHRRAVGAFPDRRSVEQALYSLRDSGFPMDRVSVITQDKAHTDDIAGADVHDADRSGNRADEGASLGATTGGVLGGLTGLLVGLGTLAIPGIGPIMLAGATATALATTLAGGAIGAIAGGLVGALIGLGIPEERARVYNERVGRGEYLVIVDGTDQDIASAEQILRQHGIQDYGVYDAPVDRSSTVYATSATTSSVPVPSPYSSTAPVREPGVDVARSKHIVGVFHDAHDTERAIADLHDSGFPLAQVTLIASHDVQRWQPYGGIDIRDRFDAIRYGIPADRARTYDDFLAQQRYLVIVRGTEEELRAALEILNRHHMQGGDLYDPTLIQSTRPTDEIPGSVSPVASSVTERAVPSTQSASHTPNSVISTPLSTTVSTSPSTAIASKRAVGAFRDHRAAEMALTDLQNAGFPMDRISLIGKDRTQSGAVGGVPMANSVTQQTGNKADEGAKAGAATGAALGGLGGLLVGLGTLAIPGIGPVILSGAAATALATALTGGAIGAATGGIVGGLVGLGIPENRAKIYQKHLDRGDYLIIVDGTETEVRNAESILKRHGIEEWDVYDGSQSSTSQSGAIPGRRVETAVQSDRPNGNGTVRQVSTSPEVVIVDRRTNLQ